MDKVGGTVNGGNMTLQPVSVKSDKELARRGGRVGRAVPCRREEQFLRPLGSPEDGSCCWRNFYNINFIDFV